jgi:hypothetical protein
MRPPNHSYSAKHEGSASRAPVVAGEDSNHMNGERGWSASNTVGDLDGADDDSTIAIISP